MVDVIDSAMSFLSHYMNSGFMDYVSVVVVWTLLCAAVSSDVRKSKFWIK